MRPPHTQTLRRSPASRSRLRPTGLSLVEVVVSTVVVGCMLAAALSAVAASRRSQYVAGSRGRGELLAQDLMSEILTKAYRDGDGALQFAPDPGESQSTRQDWDDVDDYDGWSSCPPVDETGTALADSSGWTRSVEVVWVSPADLAAVSPTDQQVKRITVTVKRGNQVMASLTAVRTAAWQQEGRDPVDVLLIVTDPAGPTAAEQARKTLMESWGFTVSLVAASADQGSLDAALAGADVVYVPAEIDAAPLAAAFDGASAGVVNEHRQLIDDLGFAQGSSVKNLDATKVIDGTHYITSGRGQGYKTIFLSPQPVCLLQAAYAPDLATLTQYYDAVSEANNKPALVVLDVGSSLYGGGTAAGRRVQLPWGDGSFDFDSLNGNGRSIMKRAIEWASEKERRG